MFLSDELEEIIATTESKENVASKVHDAFIARMPNPDVVGTVNYLNSLRQLDYAYKLFCKDHSEFNPDWFRNKVIKCIPEESKESIIKFLKW